MPPSGAGRATARRTRCRCAPSLCHTSPRCCRSLPLAVRGRRGRSDGARDPREDEAELAFVPEYYRQGDLVADCWFRLWDIRRLVADDTVAVVHELRNLLNTRYHDKPVSIYGGMLDLPLIVTEIEPREYFDTEYRDHLTSQKLWAQFDTEQAGIGSLIWRGRSSPPPRRSTATTRTCRASTSGR
jgi:hypothetical protein